jgi:ABC-type amino acid transport substrate-binding protein
LNTPFNKVFSGELVLMMGSNNTSLRRDVNRWLSQEIARGGIQRLFDHWMLLKS